MLKSIKYSIAFFLAFQGLAQNEEDILRMSTTDVFGSARFESMAGSFGALGADFSAIQINPAGMGRFSSSQFSFSMNSIATRTSSIYNGTESSAGNFNLKPGVVGFVLTSDASTENTGTLFRQISLGYTRLKSFDLERHYEGQNFNSILDVFANMGYGIDPMFIYDALPQTTGLAYDVYALDFNDITGEYIPRLTAGDMYHNRTISTTGGIGEFHIGYSENHMNNLYYGVSLGIRRIRYNEFYRHNEVLLEPQGVSLREFDYMHTLRTEGRGFNLKAGILYLPSDEFRIGFAFESPTVLQLRDNWFADMTAEHDFGSLSIPSQFILEQQFLYRMRTPMKLRPSAAIILNGRGALNLDLEYVNFGRGRLLQHREEPFIYNFSVENSEAAFQFRPVINTRIGFEYMIARDVFFRAGYALLPQPFDKSIGNVTTPNQTFATGLGLKINKWTLDLGYRGLNVHSNYFAFDPSKPENGATFNTWFHSFVVSISSRF
jgi:long-subunit fatty acid transport protein